VCLVGAFNAIAAKLAPLFQVSACCTGRRSQTQRPTHCRCYHNLFRLMRKCGVLENLLAKEHTHTFCNTGGDVRELDFRFDVNGVKIGAPFHGAGAPVLQSVHVPHCACHTAIPHRPTGTGRIMRNSGSAGSQLEHSLACRVEGFLHHPAADSHRQGAHAAQIRLTQPVPLQQPCACTAASMSVMRVSGPHSCMQSLISWSC
jgi:hypothetical protein